MVAYIPSPKGNGFYAYFYKSNFLHILLPQLVCNVLHETGVQSVSHIAGCHHAGDIPLDNPRSSFPCRRDWNSPNDRSM